MIREAIILAGGSGSRLLPVWDKPKVLAPVSGKPFLHYVLAHLQQQGIESFIFCIGQHQGIAEFLETQDISYRLSIEEVQAGTGGAVSAGCALSTEPDVLVVNGDTLFKVQLAALSAFHTEHHAATTLALKPVENTGRYGTVEINKDGYIQSFTEKKQETSGLINGGTYALNVARFLSLNLPRVFSFEKNYLETYYTNQKMMGIIQDEYFIDIGIPEDLEKANKEIR